MTEQEQAEDLPPPPTTTTALLERIGQLERRVDELEHKVELAQGGEPTPL